MNGAAQDCNLNSIPDSCDIGHGTVADCDGNGVPDTCDLATGVAPDRNENGIPDACDSVFLRGEVNCDGIIDISDPVYIFEWLFLGGHDPGCLAALDVNGDVEHDLTDGIWLLQYKFDGIPPPVAPYPACGVGSATDLEIGCESSAPACTRG